MSFNTLFDDVSNSFLIISSLGVMELDEQLGILSFEMQLLESSTTMAMLWELRIMPVANTESTIAIGFPSAFVPGDWRIGADGALWINEENVPWTEFNSVALFNVFRDTRFEVFSPEEYLLMIMGTEAA